MTETINLPPALGSEAFPSVGPVGKIHVLKSKPFTLTQDISPADFAANMAFLGARPETNPCLPVRWLSDGSSFGVIQFCELQHHMDGRAHRMTNLDGSVTTWRN
jgi:hypothetical protein